MKFSENKWVYLIVLSIVWGSSFILMKKALVGLNPLEVGALRILISSLFLVLIGYKKLTKIKPHHWKWILCSGLLGTFFPAFLFTFAIKGLDSSIASILNSSTPFNALWIGLVFFGFAFKPKQVIGIIVGLIGAIVLIYQGADINPEQNYWYAILPIIASVGYAFNVNIIKKYLQDLDPLAITTGSFILITIPAFLVLIYSGFFNNFHLTSEVKYSLLFTCLLAILGTSLAKVMFNKLIHISSPVFSTSVTYFIPVVAVIWGVLDGEHLNILQLFAAIIILLGVWLVNKAK